MSRVNTETLSISVPRELAEELRAASERTGIPYSRLAAQGMRMRLDQISGPHSCGDAYNDHVAAEARDLGPVTRANLGAAHDLLRRMSERFHPIAYARLREGVAAIEAPPTSDFVDPRNQEPDVNFAIESLLRAGHSDTRENAAIVRDEIARLRGALNLPAHELSGAEATIPDPPGTTKVR